MGLLTRFFFGSGKDVKRSTYIWNTLAGIFSALESVLFSIIATRAVGLADAGIITLGFAVGNLFATVGKYGVKTFQVTDVDRKYSFGGYFYTRLITIGAMVLTGCAYIAYCYAHKGYSVYKAAVVLMICGKFVVEVFEDVFAGECQKNGRLDVGAKVFVARSFSFILLFSAVVIATGRMIPALACALAGVVLVEAVSLRAVHTRMAFAVGRFPREQIRQLLVKCAPLFLSTFSFFYMTNAPKYAIDTVMSDEVQACYGFIAFPVFAIELLNNFIYQPTLVSLAEDWTQRRLSKVRGRLHRQVLIVLGLTCAALVGGYFLGIPILSLVFGTDLAGYKTEMLFLLLAGGLLAMIGYFTTVLITMRQSMVMMVGYIVDAALSFALYTPVIRRFGIVGGVLLYCGMCLLFALYEYVMICVNLGRAARERR